MWSKSERGPLTRVLPVAKEFHASHRVTSPCQSLHICVKASHKYVVCFLFCEFRWLSPNSLISKSLKFGLLRGNVGILRVCLSAKIEVCNSVFVTAEHLGVSRENVSGKSHGSNHLSWLAFKKAATPSSEDRVSCENTSVHSSSHLVALRKDLYLMLLAFSRPLDWLE